MPCLFANLRFLLLRFRLSPADAYGFFFQRLPYAASFACYFRHAFALFSYTTCFFTLFISSFFFFFFFFAHQSSVISSLYATRLATLLLASFHASLFRFLLLLLRFRIAGNTSMIDYVASDAISRRRLPSLIDWLHWLYALFSLDLFTFCCYVYFSHACRLSMIFSLHYACHCFITPDSLPLPLHLFIHCLSLLIHFTLYTCLLTLYFADGVISFAIALYLTCFDDMLLRWAFIYYIFGLISISYLLRFWAFIYAAIMSLFIFTPLIEPLFMSFPLYWLHLLHAMFFAIRCQTLPFLLYDFLYFRFVTPFSARYRLHYALCFHTCRQILPPMTIISRRCLTFARACFFWYHAGWCHTRTPPIPPYVMFSTLNSTSISNNICCHVLPLMPPCFVFAIFFACTAADFRYAYMPGV